MFLGEITIENKLTDFFPHPGEVADPGVYLCRPVVGKDLFLPESVLDLLPGVPALLIDIVDHHGVQLHLDALLLPEGILQEVPLQFLEGDHLIQGEGHLHCQGTHLHLHAGDLLFAENHHRLGLEGHLLLAIVVHQLVHQGGHHLLHVEGLLGTDFHQVDIDLHLQRGVGQDPHLLEGAGHGLHLPEGAGHGPHLQEGAGHGPHLLGAAGHAPRLLEGVGYGLDRQ